MNETISRGWRSVFNPNRFFGAVFFGAAVGITGGIAAGVAARLAMRAIALLIDQPPGFTLQGTLFIVGLGALMGAWLGILFGFLFPFLRGSMLWRGLVFGLAPALVFAALIMVVELEGELGLAPRQTTAALFASIPVLYGAVLGLVAPRLIPPHWEFAPVSKPFVRTAGLLVVFFALAGAIIETILAITHPASINLNFFTARRLNQIAGGCILLMSFTGLASLMRSGATGKSALGKLGLGCALVSIALLGFVAAFSGLDSVGLHGLARLMDGRSTLLSDWLLLTPLLLGFLGMLAAGIAVLQTRQWKGWRAYTLLAIGLLPVLSILLLHPALLPALVKALVSSRNQIGLWLGALYSAGWLALGVALLVETGQSFPAVGQALEPEAAHG